MAMLPLHRNLKPAHFRCFQRLLATLSTKSHKFNIEVGDTLPDVKIYENAPNNKISLHDVFRGKKGILFSVVGAFLPGCKSHIPEYLKFHDNFENEGYRTIACMAVNDPFVMEAWGKVVDPQGKIRMLADTNGELTDLLNARLEHTSLLGTVRSKRFALLIDDNVVTNISREPDHTGLACLLCIQRMHNPD